MFKHLKSQTQESQNLCWPTLRHTAWSLFCKWNECGPKVQLGESNRHKILNIRERHRFLQKQSWSQSSVKWWWNENTPDTDRKFRENTAVNNILISFNITCSVISNSVKFNIIILFSLLHLFLHVICFTKTKLESSTKNKFFLILAVLHLLTKKVTQFFILCITSEFWSG